MGQTGRHSRTDSQGERGDAVTMGQTGTVGQTSEQSLALWDGQANRARHSGTDSQGEAVTEKRGRDSGTDRLSGTGRQAETYTVGQSSTYRRTIRGRGKEVGERRHGKAAGERRHG